MGCFFREEALWGAAMAANIDEDLLDTAYVDLKARAG
jgi:hypothetical protein